MASKELSILLTAKDLASKTIGKVRGEVSALGRVGGTIGRGISTLGRNLAIGAAAAAVGIGAAVKAGLDSLATLESATTAVGGAITQVGLAGKVTADQVAGWANEIESAVGSAFDDKDITKAAASLIRYGKVTADNLRPAMVVMTDLAAKTGSVDSAATLLAKALADPEKAAGKLARTGVVLTKEQQDQIKAMAKAGKTAEAQKFLLEQLAKTTKDAARDSQGPYTRSMRELGDAVEDAQRALAIGFLPVIQRARDWLKTKLADPAVLASIRSFGEGLAKGLEAALDFVQRIPWGTVGTAMGIAGKAARGILDAFMAMPDWVRVAVATGWGLNKLTGGAVGGIASGLAKGLAQALGGSLLTRGGTPANPLFVMDVSGGKGGPGGMLPTSLLSAPVLAAVALIAAGLVGSVVAIQPYRDRTDALAARGLTQAEIQAKMLSEMSPADRARAFKTTGILPENRTQAGYLVNLTRALDKLAAKLPEPGVAPDIATTRTAKLEMPGDRPAGEHAGAAALPGAAGVITRAVARGLSPSNTAVVATLRRNEERAAARQRGLAAAARMQAMFTAISNLRLGLIASEIRNLDLRPQVTVPVTLSSVTNITVSSLVRRTTVASSYGRLVKAARPVYGAQAD